MKIRDMIPWAHKDDKSLPKGSEQNPVAHLQSEMNQMFEAFRDRFAKSLGDADWPWSIGDARADVVRTGDAIEVTVELPGMEMQDIEVAVSGDSLVVTGEKKVERKEEKTGYYLSERSYGAVTRRIPLPPGVDAEHAEASLAHGVLTIRLPQKPDATSEARRIEIKPA